MDTLLLLLLDSRAPAGAHHHSGGMEAVVGTGLVGSGKTALVAALCRALSGELTIGVVTNDIYTTEDADFLRRAGEPPGHATLRWDVTRLGRPVLRQFADLDLGLTAGRRVLACALISDPAGTPRTVVASPVAVAQRVDDDTVLVSVLDDDAARATRQLDELCARARG